MSIIAVGNGRTFNELNIDKNVSALTAAIVDLETTLDTFSPTSSGLNIFSDHIIGDSVPSGFVGLTTPRYPNYIRIRVNPTGALTVISDYPALSIDVQLESGSAGGNKAIFPAQFETLLMGASHAYVRAMRLSIIGAAGSGTVSDARVLEINTARAGGTTTVSGKVVGTLYEMDGGLEGGMYTTAIQFEAPDIAHADPTKLYTVYGESGSGHALLVDGLSLGSENRSYKLHVDGTVHVTGNLTVGNVSIAGSGNATFGYTGHPPAISQNSGGYTTISGADVVELRWANISQFIVNNNRFQAQQNGAFIGRSDSNSIQYYDTGLIYHSSGTHAFRGLVNIANLNGVSTNTVDDVITIRNFTSGTPAAGFGSGIKFLLESSTTTDRDAGWISCGWGNATDASRNSYLRFITTVSGSDSNPIYFRNGMIGMNTSNPSYFLSIYSYADIPTNHNFLNGQGAEVGGANPRYWRLYGYHGSAGAEELRVVHDYPGGLHFYSGNVWINYKLLLQDDINSEIRSNYHKNMRFNLEYNTGYPSTPTAFIFSSVNGGEITRLREDGTVNIASDLTVGGEIYAETNLRMGDVGGGYFGIGHASRWNTNDALTFQTSAGVSFLQGTQVHIRNSATTLIVARGNLVGIGRGGGATPATDVVLYGNTQIDRDDAATDTVTDMLTLLHNTSGTPAAGFGSGIAFKLESSTTEDREAAQINAFWNVATDASRAGVIELGVHSTAGYQAKISSYLNRVLIHSSLAPGMYLRVLDYHLDGRMRIYPGDTTAAYIEFTNQYSGSISLVGCNYSTAILNYDTRIADAGGGSPTGFYFDMSGLGTGQTGTIYTYNHFGGDRPAFDLVASGFEFRIDNTSSNLSTLPGGVVALILRAEGAEVTSGNAYYLGDADTDGSWRIIRSGDALVMQRREASSWVTKSTISA